ncbi:hypothetical protein F4778DRAFT_246097 [Xylariomycetidae sp. FL2044]|nr:hypothetical protein F4778DRAFT_246097 [Xylariomycetidae sp. FL2044]
MAGGSRQPHNKTRNACKRCKERRVRCNLQGPVCGNCHRRNEFCNYDYNVPGRSVMTDPAAGARTREATLTNDAYGPIAVTITSSDVYVSSSSSSNSSSISSSSSSSSSVIPTQQLFASDAASSQNQDIFSESVFGSLIADLTSLGGLSQLLPPQVKPNIMGYAISWFLDRIWIPGSPIFTAFLIWEEYYGQLDSRYKYLVPCICSLRSLYQIRKWSPDTFTQFAEAYQCHINASILFRETEQEVNENNWLPILLFGTSQLMFSFATAQSVPDHEFNYFEVLLALRRAAHLAAELSPHLEASHFHAFLSRQRGPMKINLDSRARQAIDELGSVVYPSGTPDPTRQACDQAIISLQSFAGQIDEDAPCWRQFLSWPQWISDEFVHLLTFEKHPVALITLIYWCAIMNNTTKRRFLDSWPRRVAYAAMADLDVQWMGEEILSWPISSLAEQPTAMI